MKSFLMTFLKGILIGIGKIIPGVSGAMIAISLGIYEKTVKIINHFFKDIDRHLKFLIPLFLGIVVGILLFSNIILKLLDNFFLPTMLLFIGLIIGGTKSIIKEVNLKSKANLMLIIPIIVIVIIINTLNIDNKNTNNFFSFIIMGIIEAVTMIVPGISGTAILMVLGYYTVIMEAFTIINIAILIPFSIGIIIGSLVVIKLINYLFNNYKETFYVIILALSISSIILMFLLSFNNSYTINEVVISLLLLMIGYKITDVIEN